MNETATNPIPFSPAEAEAELKQLPGWALNADATAIEKRFIFPNFISALAFVNQLGEKAENIGHHPDFTLGWGYVGITLTTHDIGGLHANDFAMAQAAERLVAA